MNTSSITASLLGLAMVLSPMAGAQAAELKVLAGGSMTASLNELEPHFERATGHKVTIHFAATPESDQGRRPPERRSISASFRSTS